MPNIRTILALLALLLVAVCLVHPSPSSAQTATEAAVTERERAFVEALRRLEQDRAAAAAADGAYEAARAARAVAQARHNEARAAAVGDRDDRLAVLKAEMAAVSAGSVVPAEEEALRDRLAKAKAVVDIGRRATELVQARLRGAGADVAVLRLDIETGTRRLSEDEKTLETVERRQRLLADGDVATFEQFARDSRAETAGALAILDQFEERLKIATTTARIALAPHMLELKEIERRFRQLDIRYCPDFGRNARMQMTQAIQGLETFLQNSANNALASFHLEMAELSRKLARDGATRCSTLIATAAVAWNEAELGAVRSRVEEGRRVLAEKTAEHDRRLRTRQDAAETLPVVTRELDDALAEVAAIEAALAANADAFAAARAHLEAERDRRVASLASEVRALEEDIATRVGPLDAELALVPIPSDEERARARRALETAERTLVNDRRDFLLALLQDELRRGLAVETRLLVEGRTRFDTRSACIRMTNRSRFAVETMIVGLQARGRPIETILGHDGFRRPTYGDGHDTGGTVRIDLAQNGFLKFHQLLRGTVYVDKLLPGQTSRFGCMELRTSMFDGADQSTLQSQRLDRFSGADWRLEPRSIYAVEVVRAGGDGAAPAFQPIDPARLYADRLARAERVAAARDAPSGGADRSAVLDTGTIAEVQKALNEAGFDVGRPDGVAGPRTRDAIRRWQVTVGAAATGELTPSQVRQLTGR